MEKEFVPYIESLELKELGFDEPCFARYYKAEPHNIQYFLPNYAKNFNEKQLLHNKEVILYYSTPTFSQAFRWFRDKYDLHQVVLVDEKGKYDIIVGKRISGSCLGQYKTYEEAELKCLKKLIEIVKEKK